MFLEVRKYFFKCDVCRVPSSTLETDEWGTPDLPKGWTEREVTDCGLTGYDKTIDVCPACSKKPAKRSK